MLRLMEVEIEPRRVAYESDDLHEAPEGEGDAEDHSDGLEIACAACKGCRGCRGCRSSIVEIVG